MFNENPRGGQTWHPLHKVVNRIREFHSRNELFRSEIEALYKIFRRLVTTNKTKSSQGKIKSNANTPSIIGKPTNIQEVRYVVVMEFYYAIFFRESIGSFSGKYYTILLILLPKICWWIGFFVCGIRRIMAWLRWKLGCMGCHCFLEDLR